MDGTDLQKLGFRDEDTLKAQQAATKDMSGVKNRKLPRPLRKVPRTPEASVLLFTACACFCGFFTAGEEFVSGMHIKEKPKPATSRRNH